MTLEQQVADLVTATSELTGVVNNELNKVRSENTNFQSTVVLKTGSTMSGDLSVPKIKITDASSNTFFGFNSGNNIVEDGLLASRNVAFGNNTLQRITDGSGNTVVGSRSGRSLTAGSFNTVIGQDALSYCLIHNSNTAIGNGSLHSCLGHNNTGVGAGSLGVLTTFNDCVGIGLNANVSGSNQVQLGDSSTTTYVFGTVQNRSDVRDKTDVRNTILGLDFIKSLRPVDYRWDMREDYKPDAPQDPGIEATDEQEARYQSEVKIWLEACKLKNIVHNGTKKRNRFHHGLIAQEVKAVLTQKGIDFGGYQDHSINGGDDVLSLGYDQFIAPLIKAVQELSAQNEALVVRISALESNLK